MKQEESDLDEIEETTQEEEIAVPKITEIMKNPIKLIDYNYEVFIQDKMKEQAQILKDLDTSMKEWSFIADDDAFKNGISIVRGKSVISELKKCFWNYRLMFERANKTIGDIKSNLEEYYVLKAEVHEEAKEEKKVLEKIDEVEEKRSHDFITACIERTKNHESNPADDVVYRKFVCYLTKPDRSYIETRFRSFAVTNIEQMAMPEELKNEVLLILFDLYKSFFNVFLKYPFRWVKFDNQPPSPLLTK